MRIVSAVVLVLALLSAAARADEKEAALRKEVQAAPAGSEAQKRAGQKLCFYLRGPLAVALWAGNDVVCDLVNRKP